MIKAISEQYIKEAEHEIMTSGMPVITQCVLKKLLKKHRGYVIILDDTEVIMTNYRRK